jgi:hypothetical protein
MSLVPLVLPILVLCVKLKNVTITTFSLDKVPYLYSEKQRINQNKYLDYQVRLNSFS